MAIMDGNPAWKSVTAMADAEVDAITRRVGDETGLDVESFYGV